MGYVFTPKEFARGGIPSPADYVTAMEILREGLEELFNNRTIYGANIHGSNFHVDGGVGSDVDVLVVTGPVYAEEYLNRIYRDVKEFTNVPVEFVPVQEHLASVGLHHIDLFYANYIKKFCREGIIGEDPISMIKPSEAWKDPKKEVSDRLVSNLSKFAKMRAVLSPDYNEEHCDFLEKLIRQPIYAAIDALRLKNGGDYPSENGRPLSKSECCKLYAQEFPEMGTEDLQAVLKMRGKYRQFLRERRGKTKNEYIRLLEEIGEIYPSARKVIETNLELVTCHGA